MRMSDGSVSLEDQTITAARKAVDEIILTATAAVMLPVNDPNFDQSVMSLYATIVLSEGLLATTANAYPHREPECFEMYRELSIAKAATEKLLRSHGINPLVIDL